MNSNQVFTGTIRRCTKYETHATFSSETFIGDISLGTDSLGYIKEDSVVEKENAVLIQVASGGYVDVESYKSAVDYFKVRQSISSDGFRLGGLIMSTRPHREDCLYVDSATLKPYYSKSESKNISVRKLKKELKLNNHPSNSQI